MENWAEIRRRVLVDGLSKRSACREYDLHWDTLTEDPLPRRAARLPPHGPPAQAQARPLPGRHPPDPRGRQEGPQEAAAHRQPHLRAAPRRARLPRRPDRRQGGRRRLEAAVRRGLRPAGPPARRGPGRLRRGRGHARRPARQGGAVRDDPAVLRRDLRLRLPARVHRGVPRGARPGLRLLRRRARAGSATTTPRSPWPRSSAAATASSPTRSCGSRAITCSSPTSAWCGGPTRRGTSRRWSASPAATSSSRCPPSTAAWSRSTPTSEARCRDDLTRRLWGKPAIKADRLDEERPALLPLPAEAFVAARVEPRCVDSLSLVSFDANQYSVPTEFAHHRVTVVATVDTGPDRRRRPRGGDPPPVLGPRAGLLRAGALPGRAGAQARGAGLRGAPGGLGAAGLLRRPAAAAGGRARRAGDAAVHQGPAAPGVGRAWRS